MKQIKIMILKDGTVSADMIDGPGGEWCLDNLNQLLADLGVTVEDKRKDTFYQATNDVGLVYQGVS